MKSINFPAVRAYQKIFEKVRELVKKSPAG